MVATSLQTDKSIYDIDYNKKVIVIGETENPDGVIVDIVEPEWRDVPESDIAITNTDINKQGTVEIKFKGTDKYLDVSDADSRLETFKNKIKVYIIDDQNRVHMAHMDIHYGFSVNGVAALHTEILKDEELKPFYDIYPEKFNNKTNGITLIKWFLFLNQQSIYAFVLDNTHCLASQSGKFV